MTQPSFSPELIACLDLQRAARGFHYFGVFFDPQTRQYWTSTDYGCSCPVPWENHRSRDDYDGPYNTAGALWSLDSVAAVADSRHEGWFADAYRSVREKVRKHSVGVYDSA